MVSSGRIRWTKIAQEQKIKERVSSGPAPRFPAAVVDQHRYRERFLFILYSAGQIDDLKMPEGQDGGLLDLEKELTCPVRTLLHSACFLTKICPTNITSDMYRRPLPTAYCPRLFTYLLRFVSPRVVRMASIQSH